MIHSSWVWVAPVLRARSGSATFSDAMAAATAPSATQTTARTAEVLTRREVPGRDVVLPACFMRYVRTDMAGSLRDRADPCSLIAGACGSHREDPAWAPRGFPYTARCGPAVAGHELLERHGELNVQGELMARSSRA